MNQYRCVYCEAAFEHPNVKECESIDGRCALLICAGWKPVWVRVALDCNGEVERHIFSKGGWICSNCVAQFAPSRPAHRRRTRRRNHRDHDRELS